jgi:hypothetical protein
MLRIAVRLEHIGDVGVDSTIVTLSRVLVISVALFDEAAPDRPYAYAYARLVPRLTYGLYRIKWLWGVSVSLTLADMAFATEGPVRGVIETIYNQRCGSMFVETVDL